MLLLTLLACSAEPPPPDPGPAAPPAPVSLRIATFNTALSRDTAGALAAALSDGTDDHARSIAAVLQTVRPDVVLIQELDASDGVLDAFHDRYLAVGQDGREPLTYPHRWMAPTNTGRPSGVDLDGDGQVAGPGDALGFGEFPGRYAFGVLSVHPLGTDEVRSFRDLLWRDVPGTEFPTNADGSSWYSDAALAVLPVSSKNHVDLPVEVADGTVLHLLASHPTPPVFDGDEDRNGLRNRAEVALWATYLDPASPLPDDAGRTGGLADGAHFAILGDLNADPVDGDSRPGTMDLLLGHPRVHTASASGALVPASAGGAQNAQSAGHRGDPAHDTAAWGLRVDYALVSDTVTVDATGVHWPVPGEAGAAAAEASDHRLVWVDLQVPR